MKSWDYSPSSFWYIDNILSVYTTSFENVNAIYHQLGILVGLMPTCLRPFANNQSVTIQVNND